ncbi:hypothetical protein BKA67DRAFT_541584 [Truncatella angustata]|uniref:Uncharacterized protein n=1 Tax=Truncatella angustata TaxID=152316 RepID=A0A9P8RLA1_9PEZI|nr:uncharacterized protein BKA67DRAFT_541584 [Truncatella angustata]KAH6645355.1 hypothetical protein BKA67DRAFT_541584 [Truncatella angustata]
MTPNTRSRSEREFSIAHTIYKSARHSLSLKVAGFRAQSTLRDVEIKSRCYGHSLQESRKRGLSCYRRKHYCQSYRCYRIVGLDLCAFAEFAEIFSEGSTVNGQIQVVIFNRTVASRPAVRRSSLGASMQDDTTLSTTLDNIETSSQAIDTDAVQSVDLVLPEADPVIHASRESRVDDTQNLCQEKRRVALSTAIKDYEYGPKRVCDLIEELETLSNALRNLKQMSI